MHWQWHRDCAPRRPPSCEWTSTVPSPPCMATSAYRSVRYCVLIGQRQGVLVLRHRNLGRRDCSSAERRSSGLSLVYCAGHRSYTSEARGWTSHSMRSRNSTWQVTRRHVACTLLLPALLSIVAADPVDWVNPAYMIRIGQDPPPQFSKAKAAVLRNAPISAQGGPWCTSQRR